MLLDLLPLFVGPFIRNILYDRDFQIVHIFILFSIEECRINISIDEQFKEIAPRAIQ